MKKHNIKFVLGCALALVFSNGVLAHGAAAAAAAAGAAAVQAKVEIVDLPAAPASAERQAAHLERLLGTLAAERVALAAELGRDAAQLLQQGLRNIDLPGREASAGKAPLAPALVTVVGD